MIEKIRKPTKSKNFVNYIVYALIFGMIIASFVLMIPGLGGGGVQSASDAATVGSVSISRREYLDQVKQLESQYTQMFNGEFPEFMRERVKKSALDNLVRTEVLANYANKKGLRIATDEVGYMLKEAPVFQEDGEFSRDRYDNYLSYLGKSAAQFEAKLMKQIATQRLNEFFSDGLIRVPQESALSELADSMSVEYEFIELSPSFLKNQIKVDDAEVAAVLASPETAKPVEQFYERVKSDFMGKESVEVSQILVDGKAVDARAKADALRAKTTKDNFAQMAKENSIDPITKEKGGALGAIEKGEFEVAIEAKAFSMKPGEISEPIKTKEGYAILLVGEKKEPKAVEFPAVKKEVAKLYLKSEGAKALSKELDKLASEKSFAALSTKVDQAGLKWNNPGKFSLSDKSLPGIGQSQEIEDAVFSLKAEGEIYPKTLSYQGKEYLLRLVKINKVADEKDKKKLINQPGRGLNLLNDVFQKHRDDLNVSVNPSLFES